MKTNIVVGKVYDHAFKKVMCNGEAYQVPFPCSSPRYISILSKIEIEKQYESCVAILSKKQVQVSSLKEFYVVKEQAQKYFDISIEIDSLQFALTILSHPEDAFQQLDSLKFADLARVLKHGHDSISERMHSKLNRRIKRYLGDSKRQEKQKDQIRRLIHLMKSDSTDQEFDQLQKELLSKKANKNINSIAKSKIVEKRLKEPEQDSRSQINSEFSNEKVQKKYKKQQAYKEVKDDENDWVDVKQEKQYNRKEKNYKKLKILEEVEADSNEEQVHQNNEKSKKRNKNKEKGGNFKEKIEADIRMTLGIIGDTDEGWRERFRVKKQPLHNIASNTQKGQTPKEAAVTEETK